MRFLIVFLAIFVVALHLRADDPQLADFRGLDADLRAVIGKHYPNAKFELTGGEYRISADTMTFTLHHKYRDGRISADTYQTVGPQYRGFVILIDDLGEKSYNMPLVIPQTLREPYWYTYVNEVQDRVSRRNLWARYQYGSRVNPDFHQAVILLLGDKRSSSPRSAASAREGGGKP